MFATFNRFEIEMTKNEAHIGYHSGDCESGIKYLLTLSKIKRQLKKISDNDLIAELKEYSVWSDEELSVRKDNELRIIWLAAGNIIDSY